MRCFKALPSSERTFQIFFSLNQDTIWCVEGINFQNYMAITSNNEHARRFMWERVMERGIETPDNGVHHIDMSENGLDFKSIDRLTDTEDDSKTDKDNSSENETNKEKLSSNDDIKQY
ncbi:uncharacterized protein LOC141525937 isoform X2 [Cotesia typhae]|uniref:uncharacterized protein LOC141525937 isoform X2 n=1 Tax=Cotesia typhae TaxID=2053667 RepID=UPI003D690124